MPDPIRLGTNVIRETLLLGKLEKALDRVGNQADFAHRPHPLHRLQLVEHIHRLQRHRQPDPRLQSPGQAINMRHLAANRAPIVAIEKADQADAVGVGGRDELFFVQPGGA